jgi:exodeoxyribonuclease VII small subunit
MGNTGPRYAPKDHAATPGGGGADAGQERETSFEEAQRELEGIVERLERGQAGLDETIALWERGEELYRLCLGRLDAARGRIEELARQGADASDAG